MEEAVANFDLIDDATGLEDLVGQVLRNFPDAANDSYQVSDVRLRSATEATVTYDIVVARGDLADHTQMDRSGFFGVDVVRD